MAALCCWLAAAAAAAPSSSQGPSASVPIALGRRTGTTAPTFLAHGWEPWTATQAFPLFDDPALVRALSHLRGQTIRFGGISADWLEYVVDSAVSPPCTWGRKEGRPFTAGGQCPFSTGALDRLLDLMDAAGIGLLFDLNELIGRNCTQPIPSNPAKSEWCGDPPAPWDIAPVISLLEHVHARNESGLPAPLGYEMGNELFAPRHMTEAAAVKDIDTLAGLLKDVYRGQPPPRFFATGTNDCNRNSNRDTIAALVRTKMDTGFSFHSYPGNRESEHPSSICWRPVSLTGVCCCLQCSTTGTSPT